MYSLLCTLYFTEVDQPAHKVRIYCIKSTTVYVPSSELGLIQPLSRQPMCPFPQNQGGGAHSPAGEVLGESQFRRLEKSLALCLLCKINREDTNKVAQSKGFSPYRTGLYTFSHILVLNVFNVGHPAKA
jgi:hypothetical protein